MHVVPLSPSVTRVAWLIVPGILAVLLAARPDGQGASSTPSRDALERAYRANNIGAAWLERFEYAKAAENFREALRIAPTLGSARFNLALALFYDGKLDAAVQETKAAAAALPGSAFPDYLSGLIAKAQGHAVPAAAGFARVLQKDAQDVGANLMLGQMTLQQGDAQGAAPYLRAALAADPSNATAAYNLSIALSRAGRAEDARAMLLRFQTLRESGSATTLGHSYLEQGRYAQAIVSTGIEPALIDRTVPDVRFVAEAPLRRIVAGSPPFDPLGRRFEPRELDAIGRRRIAASIAGAITLIDFDNDGDLDLVEVEPDRERLWRNTGGRFTEVATSRFTRPSGDAVGLAAVAGDYNNDGRPDLLVLRYGGTSLYRNDGGGRFTDVTAAAGLRCPGTELPIAAAFVDVDHDGDLDILLPGYVDLGGGPATRALVFPDDFPAAPTRLWRNNGDGTFTDVTKPAAISGTRTTAVVATDYDEHRDVDVLLASETTGLALFKNLRNGSFREVAREAGLTASGRVSAVAAADVNGDGRTDFFVGRRDGPSVLMLSSGRDRFAPGPPVAGVANVTAAQFVDYDDDGVTDLLTWTTKGARLLRSLGDAWQDVTDRTLSAAVRGVTLPSLAPGRALAIADIDRDGDEDIVVRTAGGVRVLRNDGGNRGGALTVRLAARVSNRSAAGSKVEMRAGSLDQRRETFVAVPPPAPLDLVFGLGGRRVVDAVRVLWPAGIVQAEVEPPLGHALTISELDRKPSSCPYLFTWNGSRFEFITDFLGGGELGDWIAPGVRNVPDPDEYVRIPGRALHPRNGRYELRVTNELEEVLYLDHVRLEAIAHPATLEVYPSEGLVSPPFPPAALYAVRHRRPPETVVDEAGHDQRSATLAVDRRSPDDFAVTSIRGYAEPHALTITVDDHAGVLLLTGWTDYAFSSDNVAAWQRGLHGSAPALQVRDGHGGWRTAVEEIGIPVGRPQTIVVDLRQPALRSHREFRIVTNMRVYWDRIAVANVEDGVRLDRIRLDPAVAQLHWRGFSGEMSPDGREPFGYDYERVSAWAPWKAPVGRYTAAGDVRDLLSSVDDRFVVARPGDEIALSFDARLPPLPAGWMRTFLLYADGFSKEMDVNSASPDQVAPLPFHGMRGYPPAGGAHPHGVALDPTVDRSRFVHTAVPSIDELLLSARAPHGATPSARQSWRSR